eukprot:GHVQ01018859.1.p1 GENE.GHVQ01018859.1~~GHVQ01018859.1.p1  ORF type:complete len:113 (-),score=7.78 GHVQ01018859.1:690-1028(-)
MRFRCVANRWLIHQSTNDASSSLDWAICILLRTSQTTSGLTHSKPHSCTSPHRRSTKQIHTVGDRFTIHSIHSTHPHNTHFKSSPNGAWFLNLCRWSSAFSDSCCFFLLGLL